MADIRFDQITDCPSITTAAYFVGTFDNGDSTFTDYKYSVSDLLAYVASASSLLITVATGGSTLTDSFFTTTCRSITTGTQTYLLGVDYSQNTSTGVITSLGDLSFFVGQKILARL